MLLSDFAPAPIAKEAPVSGVNPSPKRQAIGAISWTCAMNY